GWGRYWRSTPARPGRAWPCRKTSATATRRPRTIPRRRPTARATAPATSPRRAAARTCASSSSRPAARVQGHRLRRAGGAAERDQTLPVQHQLPDVAVDAVLGILEAEAALQAQPPVPAPPQPQRSEEHTSELQSREN